MKIKTFICTTVLTIVALVSSARANMGPLYLDLNQPIDKRVDDLVSRMTLKGKAAELDYKDLSPASSIQLLDDPKMPEFDAIK
jgi:hypothetical protein